MKDMQDHLATLRREAAKCHRISAAATDPAKRELFARLALHHEILAGEVERAIAAARGKA
jgi:hypothetical protein